MRWELSGEGKPYVSQRCETQHEFGMPRLALNYDLS
jgi:hypothetical protein